MVHTDPVAEVDGSTRSWLHTAPRGPVPVVQQARSVSVSTSARLACLPGSTPPLEPVLRDPGPLSIVIPLELSAE